MGTALRNLERAKQELAEFHRELLRLEKRADSLRESLRKSAEELLGPGRQAFSAFDEPALAARIAEAITARLPVTPQTPSVRKHYVREREAAEYMAVEFFEVHCPAAFAASQKCSEAVEFGVV